MTISRQVWSNYISTLRDINETAATKLVQYLNTHSVFESAGGSVGSDIIVNEDALKEFIDYAYAIVTQYGEASAALSAQAFPASEKCRKRSTA